MFAVVDYASSWEKTPNAENCGSLIVFIWQHLLTSWRRRVPTGPGLMVFSTWRELETASYGRVATAVIHAWVGCNHWSSVTPDPTAIIKSPRHHLQLRHSLAQLCSEAYLICWLFVKDWEHPTEHFLYIKDWNVVSNINALPWLKAQYIFCFKLSYKLQHYTNKKRKNYTQTPE